MHNPKLYTLHEPAHEFREGYVMVCTALALTNELQVKNKEGTLFTLYHHGDMCPEEQEELRRDYEFGLLLNGTKGIAKVVDWWEGASVLEPLEVLDARHPMPLKEFMRLAVQISEGVALLHKRNIVNNGISPR